MICCRRKPITSGPNVSLMRLLFSICIILVYTKDLCNCEGNGGDVNTLFINSLMQEYGANGTLTYEQFETFLIGNNSVGNVWPKIIRNTKGVNSKCDKTQLDERLANETVLQKCTVFECFTLKDIYNFYSVPNSSFNVTSLQQIAPSLLYMLKFNCIQDDAPSETKKEQHQPPSQVSVWGYGFLMVTVINLCSLVGVLVLPFMKMAAYKQILIFMVALAVGALAGSGLLCLIPEAFGLVNEDTEDLSYIFKASTVMCGIYIFYLTEKIMRILTNWKERQNMRLKKSSVLQSGDEDDHQSVIEIICSVKKSTPVNQDAIYKETATLPSGVSSCTHQELLEKSSNESTYCKDRLSDVKDLNNEEYENTSSLESSNNNRRIIKPLAWMIIFGDGLHNFIDGLSIGTAFTQSSLTGISVSVAVMCEELPHELGDFAILLNCGMSVKRALLYNFLSACMCYLGLITGILLGENTASSDWIFAIAGGMFLYISLADMMPEMNSASEANGSHSTKQIFLIQNLGLISGFGVMFILAIFGRHINFE